MEFDLENPLTSCEDEQQRRDSISDLFAAESDHIISTVGTIDLHTRRNAVSLILQVKLDIEAKKAIFFSHPFPSIALFHYGVYLRGQAQFDYGLDPLVAYLAINYVDRFLSKREIPVRISRIE